MSFFLDKMDLTPLQKRRLIFILGDRYLVRLKIRYRGHPRIQIKVNQFDKYEHNYIKALEIIRQLYWEAKRAPPFIAERMPLRERRRILSKVLGRTREERIKAMQDMMPKYEEAREEFETIKDKKFTRDEHTEFIQKKLNHIEDTREENGRN